ncbi:hypothetical protein [Psychrobacillus sp. BM2]|uniref:hypothetical protein n=1 Tax=Psychrobacillus sp. BM2 TaxID=3400421 RepID=UPI003B0147E3
MTILLGGRNIRNIGEIRLYFKIFIFLYTFSIVSIPKYLNLKVIIFVVILLVIIFIWLFSFLLMYVPLDDLGKVGDYINEILTLIIMFFLSILATSFVFFNLWILEEWGKWEGLNTIYKINELFEFVSKTSSSPDDLLAKSVFFSIIIVYAISYYLYKKLWRLYIRIIRRQSLKEKYSNFLELLNWKRIFAHVTFLIASIGIVPLILNYVGIQDDISTILIESLYLWGIMLVIPYLHLLYKDANQ